MSKRDREFRELIRTLVLFRNRTKSRYVSKRICQKRFGERMAELEKIRQKERIKQQKRRSSNCCADYDTLNYLEGRYLFD